MAKRRRTNLPARLLLTAILLGTGLYLAVQHFAGVEADPYTQANGAPPAQPVPGVPAVPGASANIQAPAQSASASPAPVTAAPAPAGPSQVSPPLESPAPAQVNAAEQAFRRGMEVYAQGGDANIVQARRLLSQALASGALPDATAHRCRQTLQAIADQVVFGRKIFDTDPYAYRYVVQGGDVLVNIVRRESLQVPAEAIQQINAIDNPRLLRVGQWLKLVRGPFHAIVTKRTYTLDLYQQDMFVKSYRVGLGQDGSTPTGRWEVSDRVRHATWTPPTTAGVTRVIRWGEPEYPLGRDGLWIALRGIDENTEMLSGFGVHGTNEPHSIGQQSSLGCIRLGDEDIAELFNFLAPNGSKLEIRP